MCAVCNNKNDKAKERANKKNNKTKCSYLCNSIAGGTVFLPVNSLYKFKHIIKPTLPFLDSTGVIPSKVFARWIGHVMLQWYKALTRFIGNFSGTEIVLAKCALDQALDIALQVHYTTTYV